VELIMFAFRFPFWCLLVFTILFAISCGPDQEAIVVTVENQVNVAVVATLTAVPTQTPYPTQTQYPTHTPYPTLTPFPTYTPYSTYTLEPSFTPTATFTPEPTATPTVSPIPTRAVTVESNDSTPPLGELRTQLLAEIDKTRTEVEQYSWIISVKLECNSVSGCTSSDLNVDCQATVNLFDSIANALVIDVVSSDPVIQNAYNNYLTAVDQFKEIAAPWTDGCREALAVGETHKVIGEPQSNTLRISIEEQSTNLLRQAILSLSDG
jgi:hypothetical protein